MRTVKCCNRESIATFSMLDQGGSSSSHIDDTVNRSNNACVPALKSSVLLKTKSVFKANSFPWINDDYRSVKGDCRQV